MKALELSRYALRVPIAAAMLAGCGGSQPPIGAPAHTILDSVGTASSYHVLYSFRGHPKDGAHPAPGLIDVDGILYGTTSDGGTHMCASILVCGTVFRITTSGAEKVLHNFGQGTDGYGPRGSLIDVNGTLYGTTFYGGAYGGSAYGTIFSITRSGKERVLHSFKGTDGAHPAAALIDVNGTLYGATSQGGGSGCSYRPGGCGTVFGISPSGGVRILHSFRGPPGDGGDAEAGLINVNGTLYGTTAKGGRLRLGTVFKVTTYGAEKVLHSFGYGNGGGFPYASLLDLNGVLYGTTSAGGGGSLGNGAVFNIHKDGKSQTLYNFFRKDGAQPLASLIDVNGTLYGTTANGGAYCAGRGGCGTVFSISTTGEEHVLHSFGRASDGRYPDASLIDVNGTLYGTTDAGGTHGQYHGGYGTVFALTP